MRFEWDPRKAAGNLNKHRVSFEEARTVFYDEEALLIADDDHSDLEERFAIIGISTSLRILVVVHCVREHGDAIRIISARKATRSEATQYREAHP